MTADLRRVDYVLVTIHWDDIRNNVFKEGETDTVVSKYLHKILDLVCFGGGVLRNSDVFYFFENKLMVTNGLI